MVSRTVKDLVTGSGIALQPRGEHELKGVPGAWELFAVGGRDGTVASARPRAASCGEPADRLGLDRGATRARLLRAASRIQAITEHR